jgi:hypothetical protein
LTRGGPGELIDFWSVVLPLASWLLRLLLSFDYQNPCLLFLKLQVEDHVWFEDRWMVASLCDE